MDHFVPDNPHTYLRTTHRLTRLAVWSVCYTRTWIIPSCLRREGIGWACRTFRKNIPTQGRLGGQRQKMTTAVPRSTHQLCPVYNGFPRETLAGEFLSELLLSHLGHQEMRLAHQGSEYISNAPRTCQDQPWGSLLHCPGNPLGRKRTWHPDKCSTPPCRCPAKPPHPSGLQPGASPPTPHIPLGCWGHH